MLKKREEQRLGERCYLLLRDIGNIVFENDVKCTQWFTSVSSRKHDHKIIQQCNVIVEKRLS